MFILKLKIPHFIGASDKLPDRYAAITSFGIAPIQWRIKILIIKPKKHSPTTKQRPLKLFKASSMAITTLAILALSQSASASIYAGSLLWPKDANDVAQIRVCVIDGSSVEQREKGGEGLIHEPNPALSTVLEHIQAALASSWGRFGTVRFHDWRSCMSLTDYEKTQAVGFYINPGATNQAYIGKGNTGLVTPTVIGAQIKPWAKGEDSTGCIFYNGWTTRMQYSFECAQQYGIHEFGHVIGMWHEHKHGKVPEECDQKETPSAAPPDFSVVNADVYDRDSIMTYSNNGKCGNNSGGVRFGGANLSGFDEAGLRNAYSPRAPGYAAYSAFSLQTGTNLPETDSNWTFAGVPDSDDIVAIKKMGGISGKTELRFLWAYHGYTGYSPAIATAWPVVADDSTEFLMGPDSDLFIVKKNAARRTELHILTKNSNYQNYSLQVETLLGSTGDNFTFLLAPNKDLIAIKKYATGTGTTEVHVISAASNYQNYTLNIGTPLHETNASFEFAMAPNRDIIAIKKNAPGMDRTEAHVLSAASNYQSFSFQTRTAQTATDGSFKFLVTKGRDLIGVKKYNTGTRTTEIHRLRH